MSQPGRPALSVLVSLAVIATALLAVVAGPARATGGDGATAVRLPAPVTAARSASPVPVHTPEDAGPVPGLLASEIRWTRWSTLVVYGGTTVLEGQVVVDDGAVTGASVEVFARPAGSSAWMHLGTVDSSTDDGVFRLNTHKPAWTADYRVVYEGNLLYARSEGTRRVPVARKISSGLTSNGDATFTFFGSVAPTYAGKTVRLQRKTSASGSWSTISSTSTSRTSRWSFRVARPSTSGTYYYRVYTPSDTRYVTSRSSAWAIRRG
ncbi:MAG: hypothetical protein ACRDV1_12795 [Actinomycetes bacterium]